MKKLRLTKTEENKLFSSIKDKFNNNFKMNVNDFTFTKEDTKNFLNAINKDKAIIKPTVRINADVYTAMYELVKQSPIEISWHGLVKRDKKEGVYTIYDLLMFPQLNSPTTTTTDEDEFAEWQMALIKDETFPIEDLRMHGHSHVNMAVFSSATDDQYQNDLIRKVEDGDYYIFLVLNKKMDMCCFIYDFDQQILFDTDDVKIEIINKENSDIRNWAKEAIAKFCKEYKYELKYNKIEDMPITYTNDKPKMKFPGRY